MPYFPVVYYGILRAGCVVVPMNVLLKEREVRFYLEDPGAKLVFAWHDFADAAEPGADGGRRRVPAGQAGRVRAAARRRPSPIPSVEDRAADDTAVILYTSGTTGKPKGAELTHGNLRRNCGTVAGTLAELSPDDVLLGALPLFHSFGQTCTMNASVANGSTVTMLPRFDPEKALEIIERDRVTLFQGVPTMYNGDAPLRSRRTARTPPPCGSACPAARRCRPS